MTRYAHPCRRCRPVLYRHEDGWDAYPASECYALPDGSLIPAWFDAAIVEDAPTRKAAVEELRSLHGPFGTCIAVAS